MFCRPWQWPLLVALSFRLLNAFCSRAFFQPDEYWQNLEVAHRWVYGYGYQTWEWRNAVTRAGAASRAEGDKWGNAAQLVDVLKSGGNGGIRSPLSVVVTAAVYAVLRATGYDRGDLLVLAPRLVQACIAASADLAVRQLALRILGAPCANAALFVSLTSFFNFHASTRTFSNSTETALTAWALAIWPWELHSRGSRINTTNGGRLRLTGALALAALASLIRPSNAVVWLVLGAQLFLRTSWHGRHTIIAVTAVIGLAASVLSYTLDSAFYGVPTFTPLRFLHANVFQSISLFYGANAWHFYLSQGIPILLATQLPFFLDGLRTFVRAPAGVPQDRDALRALGTTGGMTLAAYSLLSHKEWRFLQPLLPIMHVFATLSLVERHATKRKSSDRDGSTTSPRALCRRLRIRPRHAGILLFSLVPALYLTAFHGLAQNTVMMHLGSALERDRLEGRGAGEVAFLMPCHSTGWQAFLHRPEMDELVDPAGSPGRSGLPPRRRMWMVTCEPPIRGQDPTTYQDEGDLFYSDPCDYIVTHLAPPTLPPSSSTSARPASRVVLFSSLLVDTCRVPHLDRTETVGELLRDRLGYGEVEWEGWNTLGGWHEDDRRRGTVMVLRREG